MECNIENCPLYTRLVQVEKTSLDHEQRIRKQEEKSTAITKVEKDIEYIKEKIGPLATAIEELKSRPAKRWDILVTALISGGGALLLSNIFR